MNTNDWKQEGRVFLWRYEDVSKKLSGWNLTADSDGASSLITLIDLLLKTDSDARRTVGLTEPTDRELPVPGITKNAVAAEKLVLESALAQDRFWSLSSENDTVRLRAGRSYLFELRAGMEDVWKGRGDYCIGTNEQKLWFWWRIGA